MSTDLVRRCDGCRSLIPTGQPVYMVTAAIRGPHRQVALTEPRDCCGAECFAKMMRALFLEAQLRPVPESPTAAFCCD